MPVRERGGQDGAQGAASLGTARESQEGGRARKEGEGEGHTAQEAPELPGLRG